MRTDRTGGTRFQAVDRSGRGRTYARGLQVQPRYGANRIPEANAYRFSASSRGHLTPSPTARRIKTNDTTDLAYRTRVS